MQPRLMVPLPQKSAKKYPFSWMISSNLLNMLTLSSGVIMSYIAPARPIGM